MKTEQNNPVHMNTEPLQRLKEAEAQVAANSRALRRKSALLFTGSMVLIVILLVAGIAWYTRVANLNAMTFKVANYDFAVNNNKDGDFLIDIYEYTNVTNQKMAPGTVGYIPLELSTKNSDVAVNYQISVLADIPEGFRKHMKFFYLKEPSDNPNAVPVPVLADRAVSFRLDDNKVPTDFKVTIGGNEVIKARKNIDRVYDVDDLEVISGVLPAGQTKTLVIYWMWYWDADAAFADSGESDKSKWTGDKGWDKYSSEWDALDTDIGRYSQSDKYKDKFVVSIHASGVEATPDLNRTQTQ